VSMYYVVSAGAPTETTADKNRIPNATSGEGQDTGLTITGTPGGHGYVRIEVNGLGYVPANGNSERTTAHCYFSGDGGTTARAFGAIVATDKLYWNDSKAGCSLSGTDGVSMYYVV